MNEEMIQEGMTHVPEEKKQKRNSFSLLIISLTTFLLPALILPFTDAPFQFSKTFMVVVLVALLYGLFVLRSLKYGELVKYWSVSFALFTVLPVVYLVTALFSESPSRSFFGYQLETDTFGFMLLAVLFANAVVLSVNRSELSRILKAALYGSWVVFVFQLFQVISGLFTGTSIITGNVITNMIGKWNDFGLFAGLVGALSLLAFFAQRHQLGGKIALGFTYILSVFFLALVNLTEAWILFGVVSLGLLVLLFVQMSSESEKDGLHELLLPAVGVCAAVFFVFFGAGTSNALQGAFSVNALEVRPSVTGTLEVLQQEYKVNPILGSGPNTFSSEWLAYRNGAILNTLFWNTAFSVGSGTIPTMFITGGVLTALAWVVFSLLLIYTVFKALFITPVIGKMYVTTALSGISVLYLLVAHYVYAPSQSLTLIFALSLGVFFVSLKDTALLHTVRIKTVAPHMKKAMMVSAVVVLVVAITAVYGVGRTYASALFHERAVKVSNSGDLVRGESLVQNAITLRGQDRYYRTAALINVAQLNQLANTETPSEDAVSSFQVQLSEAVRNANEAVRKDSQSFQNWITLSSVYSSVVPLQVEGALENAVRALEEARIRSPQSPEVDYRLAQIETIVGENSDQARAYLELALTKKQNYTAAILLLAQIELDEGNLNEAIESVRAAVYFEPNNSLLLYQLGILLLQDQNYEEAAVAFEVALGIQADYSNAAFFLAQSYAFLDRFTEAANLMRQVAERNPESEVAANFATQLEIGENPFDAEEIVSPEEEDELE